MYPIIKVGPLALGTFALTVVIGIWLGNWLVARRDPANYWHKTSLSGWLIVAGLLGARLWYVLFNLDLYTAQPRLIWQLSLSGLAFPGALLASAGVCWLMWWRKKQPMLSWLDDVAVILPWMQALGMFGMLLSGEGYGLPSDLPWAVHLLGVNRQPSQIYEALGLIMLGLWLWRQSRQQGIDGRLIAQYGVGYGLIRLLLEPLRGDTLMLAGTRAAQWFGLGLMVVCLHWLWVKRAEV